MTRLLGKPAPRRKGAARRAYEKLLIGSIAAAGVVVRAIRKQRRD